MRKQTAIFTLVVALGTGTLLAVPVAPRADQAKIEQLIKQLGSDNYRQRESAAKELDAMGEMALEALKKAASSPDSEVASRAKKLLDTITQRGETARLIAPTYVELKFKDTPIEEAAAELAKQAKIPITIAGDKTKMVDRRVTLETGRVPFWNALAQFCEKAGLVEADGITGVNGPIDFPAPGIDLPGIQPVLPVKPIRIQPIQIQPIQVKPIQVQPRPVQIKPVPAPVPEEKPAEKPAKPVEEKPLKEQFSIEVNAEVKEAPAKEAPAPNAVPPQKAIAVPVQIGGAVPAQPAQGGGAAPAIQPLPIRRPPVVGGGGPIGGIVLVDGKSKVPSYGESAIRIRVLPQDHVKNMAFPAPDKDQFGFVVSLTAEPRLQLQQIVGVKIEKAVDDCKQELSMMVVENQPNPNDPVEEKIRRLQAQGIAIGRPAIGTTTAYYGPNIYPIRLKKGDKEPNVLKELNGVVTVKMRTSPEEIVSVDNVLKAKGETVKGKNDSQIRVLNVTKEENGNIKVEVEVTYSNEVLPTAQQQFFGPVEFPQGQGGIQIQPAIQIQIAPAPNAPNAPPVAPQPAIGAVPAQRAIYNPLGLMMMDSKGKSLDLVQAQMTRQMFQQNARVSTATMVFKPAEKDQEAAKLVFHGTRMTTVDIPFMLKDVPVK